MKIDFFSAVLIVFGLAVGVTLLDVGSLVSIAEAAVTTDQN